ncbi:EpsG family protein [Oceanobacillus halophilus]|uniref:EpsG family protein n=1 Tax=Oceanobacillus halophilus TaxID=930130 RepID=A0A495A252_9BACI|nr:EpsG family protein [Oceanobacillus halophilus]RKQ33501.1 EpsG family protein [Oceanobacillus halophilus]
MTLLWMNLTFVLLFALFARYFAKPVLATNLPVPVKPNKLLVFGGLTSLVLISGFRSGIGDTFNYRNIFEDNDFTWEYVTSEKDIGFGFLQMLIKNYISDNSQALIFITAFITNLLIIFVFYKYSRLVELSLYVYITGGLFLVSMNGIRQLLAAAIAFTAIKFLIEGKFIRYAFIIGFASLFHQSALILLPMFFLVRFKAWSKVTIALVLLAVIAVIGYEYFSTILFTALEDTQYSNYDNFSEGGANILRVAVEASPLFVAFLGRKKLRSIFPESDYIVNMALIGLVFMVISTEQWIFARMSIYFQLYQLILISWLPKLFRYKDQKLVYIGIIVCYLAYYYYETVISLNINYNSVLSIF